MSAKINKTFLGTGWSFPPSFDHFSSSLEMVSEEADIRQSLFILLSTTPGERLMKPKYGCDLQSAVFDVINNTMRHHLIDLITVAVIRFEPRVTVDEVKISLDRKDEGLVDIDLYYTVRKTNIRSNIVYPFYYREGTNLRDAQLKEVGT
ncbi:MAG: GPW/gp25 family protein [Bacteroidota bacterium]